MKILELHEALRAAGFDISGVSGSAIDAKITGWNTPPSKQQEADAEAIIKTFDWTESTPADVEIKIGRLTPTAKQSLIDQMLNEYLHNNPALLEKLSAESATPASPTPTKS